MDLPPALELNSSEPTAAKPDESASHGRKRTLTESNADLLQDWSSWTETDLELKEFKCPRCAQSFQTTNDLFAHMRKEYAKPAECHICGKNMKALATLLSHSYLHQGIKPYKCPKCNYSARTRFNIRVHFGSCCNVDKFKLRRGVCKKQKRSSKAKQVKPISRTKHTVMCAAPSVHHNVNNFQMIHDPTNAPPDYDLLNQLPDIGPAPANRDTTCLVAIHLQHMPSSDIQVMQAVSTNQFYAQQSMLQAAQFT